MKVALDVMGGDLAPRTIMEGAVAALEAGIVQASEVLLVGPPQIIGEELVRLNKPADLFPIVPSHEVIGMGESPAKALRSKKDASVLVAAKLVKEGKADALVSAGNTGAAVASCVMLWKTLKGVRRPGIAITLSAEGGRSVTIIDVGANVSCVPEDLLNYAFMATSLATDALGVKNPSVGLLNIGTEDAKGNELTKKTHALFRVSGMNFVGNLEGVDVFRGTADVLVCEGFVGNVILKLGEGLSEHLTKIFNRELKEAGIDDDLRRRMVDKARRSTDYSEYGGALLLGVDGICVICHGHSDGKAISNAIRIAMKTIKTGLNSHISTAIQEQAKITGLENKPG